MLAETLSPRELLKDGPILLYDGECGVCSRSVQWILAHERSHSLRFAPLESALGRALSAEAQISQEVDSMLWVEASEHGVRARFWSSAVFATLRYVGGPWRFLALLKVVPAPVRDLFYRTFARHRLKVAPKMCLIPRPEARARFLAT
jgi:predicted DCC family thiol-disulfide oxidoreductase YuxK